MTPVQNVKKYTVRLGPGGCQGKYLEPKIIYKKIFFVYIFSLRRVSILISCGATRTKTGKYMVR